MAPPSFRIRPRDAAFACALVAIPLGSGCGGGNAASKPVAPVASNSVVATPKLGLEDRSPVAQPPGLVVQLHLASPKSLAKALKTYFPQHAADLDARVLIGSLIGAPTLAQLVDLSAPIDAAVLLPGDGAHFAYAFGVEDDPQLEKRLAGVFSVEPRDGGVRRLVPARPTSANEPVGRFDGDCWIAPSLGATRYRLLCTAEPIELGHLAALGPWLARGVTQKPEPTSSLHLEVDLAPVKKLFDGELRGAHTDLAKELARDVDVKHAELDKVLDRLAVSLVDEAFDVVSDLDAISLDATLDDVGAKGALGLTFGHTASWVAKAELAGAEGATSPPAGLGKLPADSAWSVWFANPGPSSDALVVPLRDALLQLTEAAAIDFAFPAKDRTLALETVRLLFPRAADTYGTVGKSKDTPPASDEDKLRGLLQALAKVAGGSGFALSVEAREAKGSIDLVKSLGALLTRPSFLAMVKSLSDDRISIEAKSAPFKGKELKDLPKGSYAETLDLALYALDPPSPYAVAAEAPMPPAPPYGPAPKPAPKPKTKPMPTSKEKSKLSLVTRILRNSIVAPDGARTWVATSSNEPMVDLVARLVPALAGKAKGTWAERPGFDLLTASPVTSGALFSIEGLATTVAPRDAPMWLTSLPDGGNGVVVVRSNAGKSGQGGTATTTFAVPRDALAALAGVGETLTRWIF